MTAKKKPERKHFPTQAAIAAAYGVTKQAVSQWVTAENFPPKTHHGWNREAVAKWVDERNDRMEAKLGAAGDREEKTRLECERLRVSIARERESLKQLEIETARLKGELVEVEWVKRRVSQIHAAMRGRVESWQQHMTAKHPAHKEAFDEFADGWIKTLHETEV